ncbi:hypothetical protein V1278_002644 [Bradyrhizobium sp. AZCC 1577]
MDYRDGFAILPDARATWPFWQPVGPEWSGTHAETDGWLTCYGAGRRSGTDGAKVGLMPG